MSVQSHDAVGFPWAGAFFLALPGIGLAAVGGVIGVGAVPGIAMIGAGALYLLLDLVVLQRRLERKSFGVAKEDRAAQEFLERALSMHTVEAVADEMGRAVTRALGPRARSILLAPGADGGLRVLTGSGPQPSVDLGDPTPAFLWLGDAAEPIAREQLLQLKEFEGARETLKVCDSLGCDLLLPLLHRGMLLGLGLIQRPKNAPDPETAGFYDALRAYMTVAVANTFLDAEARGRSQLAKSFDLATTMQESLMPDERPVRREGFELRGMFRPVAECGGDLWAWRELADGKVLLLIADATGHGAAPALLSAVAKGAVDAHWQMSLRDMEPAKLLSALNTAVHRTGRKRYMMTAFAAVVDTQNGQLHYANAGQNFPYFINAATGKVEVLIARGNSLGAAAEARFESHTREMSRGDKLILYTDGITEVGTPLIEPWGEKRFRASLMANATQRAIHLPETIMGEVEQYLGGHEAMDDITMVAFQYGHLQERA